DLHDRERAVGHGVPQHDGRVREAARIDDRTGRLAVLLQKVDERALVVRLERDEIRAGVARELPAALLDGGERRRAVDLGLARSEEVQVRPVHEEELHAARSTARAAARNADSETSVTSLKRPILRGRIQRVFPARAFLSRRTYVHTARGSRARVGSAARARTDSSCGRSAGDVARTERSAKTASGEWNAPTRFLPAAMSMAVFPPIAASAIPRSVVGICATRTPRR